MGPAGDLADRHRVHVLTVLPLALVVEGVVWKSSEAGQVTRCLVAMTAAVGTLVAFAAHVNWLSHLVY